jgi:hypothetical protein
VPVFCLCSFLTVIPTEVEGPRHDSRITQLTETISLSPAVTRNKTRRLVPSLPASALSVTYSQRMSNPWLAIALEDYEGHMGSDNVRQLAALSDLFKRALDLCTPESVAVVGVAGGGWRTLNALRRVCLGLGWGVAYPLRFLQRVGSFFTLLSPPGSILTNPTSLLA